MLENNGMSRAWRATGGELWLGPISELLEAGPWTWIEWHTELGALVVQSPAEKTVLSPKENRVSGVISQF